MCPPKLTHGIKPWVLIYTIKFSSKKHFTIAIFSINNFLVRACLVYSWAYFLWQVHSILTSRISWFGLSPFIILFLSNNLFHIFIKHLFSLFVWKNSNTFTTDTTKNNIQQKIGFGEMEIWFNTQCLRV